MSEKTDGQTRRKKILEQLSTNQKAISANTLAKQFKVSRQIIVGDIALLRASGVPIIATSRGYLLQRKEEGYYIQVACCHSFLETEKELSLIVKEGGKVMDVIVEHPVYGELKGGLHITSEKDVQAFMKKIKETNTQLLLTLTNGAHLHTLLVPNHRVAQNIQRALNEAGILYKN